MKFMTMGFLLPQSPQAISDLCRIPHPEQHQSGKTNPRHSILTGILISPEMWGVGLCNWRTHPNLFQQREDISVHHLHPAALE